MFRLGFHIQKNMESNSQWNNLILDCEYNKHAINQKTTPNIRTFGVDCRFVELLAREYETVRCSGAKSIRYEPDMIIHCRENDENNVVIFELKKTNSRRDEKKYDRAKLKYFTCCKKCAKKGNCLSYSWGVYLELGDTLGDCVVELFKNGEKASTFSLSEEEKK